MVDVIPVNIPKERLTHDFLSIRRPASETLLGFSREKFLQDGDGVPGHVDGVEGLVCENGIVDFVFVFAAEGGLLEEHLVDEDAKGPPIYCAAVLFIQQDLGKLVESSDGRRTRETLKSRDGKKGGFENVPLVP